MADITATLDEALRKHEAYIKHNRRSRSQITDGFLIEAYRIEGHIASLHTYLRSVRPPYLSTSLPSRRTPLSRTNSSTYEHVSHHHQSTKDCKYLTDAQRDQIDAECKATLRELNASIKQVEETEKLRNDTLVTLSNRKRSRNGFQALGRWAAGGVGVSKSAEEELEDAKQKTVKLHRESVIWYLKMKLEDAAGIQSGMMQTRLEREIEKSKSKLYKTKGASGVIGGNTDFGIMNGRGSENAWSGGGTYSGSSRAAMAEDMDRKKIEQQLSPEQLQLFEQENNDMLKHYEDTLDQVRTAERSMYEISELQNTLAQNLDIQSANIDLLTMDSIDTSENVGGGNKQLKRATERKSTARMVFYASCGLSVFLVIWDLIF